MNGFICIRVVSILIILLLHVPVAGMKRGAGEPGQSTPQATTGAPGVSVQQIPVREPRLLVAQQVPQVVIRPTRLQLPVIHGFQIPFEIICKIIAVLYAREKNILRRVNKYFYGLLNATPSPYITHNYKTFGIRDLIHFSVSEAHDITDVKFDERKRREKVIELIDQKKKLAESPDELVALENQLIVNLLKNTIKTEDQVRQWNTLFIEALQQQKREKPHQVSYITQLTALQYAIVSNSVDSGLMVIGVLSKNKNNMETPRFVGLYQSLLLQLAIEYGRTEIASGLLKLGAEAKANFVLDIQKMITEKNLKGIEKDLFLYTYEDLLYAYDEAGKSLAKNYWVSDLFFENIPEENFSLRMRYQESIPSLSFTSLAALLGKGTLVEFLVEKGGEVKVRETLHELLPLTAAALKGHAGMMKFLLNHQASMYEFNRFIGLNLPLSAAVWSGDMETVVILCDRAAQVYTGKGEFDEWINAKNRNLATSLDVAVDCGYHEIAQYLIARGATVNNVAVNFGSLSKEGYAQQLGFIFYDSFGLCSTLDRAIKNKDLAMVELILKKGPKIVLMEVKDEKTGKVSVKSARNLVNKKSTDENIKKKVLAYIDQYEKKYPYKKNKEKYIVIPYSSIAVGSTRDLKNYVK